VHYIESFIPGTEPTAFCPIHSPFGAVGGVSSPLGGTAPDGAPQPTAPLPSGVQPANPTPTQPAPSKPPPAGTSTGVMGGTGPTPNPHR
jgi:hypothetical protein